jgi:hypothetical protein
MLTSISALTLATHDMARAVAFYQALGFVRKFGGPAASFTSFLAGSGYLNLMSMPAERVWTWWGRAIFYVDDVDAQLRSLYRPASHRPSHRGTDHGASATSTSSIRTDTNSASRGPFDGLHPVTRTTRGATP